MPQVYVFNKAQGKLNIPWNWTSEGLSIKIIFCGTRIISNSKQTEIIFTALNFTLHSDLIQHNKTAYTYSAGMQKKSLRDKITTKIKGNNNFF